MRPVLAAWHRLLCGLAVACSAAAHAATPATLTVAADPVFESLLNRVARSFTALHGVPVDVVVAPSEQAANQARAGKAALAVVFGAPAGQGPALTRQWLGDAALSVFVNGRNPLRDISRERLKTLFTDAKPNWSQLGGRPQAIVRAPHSAFDTSGLMFDAYVRPSAQVNNDSARFTASGELPPWQARAGDFPAILYVAIDQYAVGYASSVAVWRAQADGGKVRALAIDGVAPTPRTVRDGSYPLSRPVELVYGALKAPQARLFHEFLTGPQGQDLLLDAGVSTTRGEPRGDAP